jgi:phage terminase small subunit
VCPGELPRGEFFVDWHELEKMKVTELREMAKEKANLEGVSGMTKEHLVEAIAKAMGIEKPHKVVQGAEKTKLKMAIRAAKRQRDEAQKGGNSAAYLKSRLEIRKLKHKLRRQAQVVG